MSLELWRGYAVLALRDGRQAGAFHGAAVATLALGMAGATVMFTLIQGILLRPLPVADEDRLVLSWQEPLAGPPSHVPYRAADIEEIARATTAFQAVTGVGYNGAFEADWQDGQAPITARTAAVMGEFFRVAGVDPILGRALTAADDRAGVGKAIVLSHGAWQRLFGGSPDVIGRSLVARHHGFTIVGVMPTDFEYPRGVEIWVTLAAYAATELNEAFREGLLNDVEMLARLRPGVSVEQAAGELGAITTRFEEPGSPGARRGFQPIVRPYKAVVVGGIDRALVLLFAAVALILIIASANVANLLLVRGESKRNELVIRAALGASRGRLMAQQLAESVVLSLFAGVVALLLAEWSLPAVTRLVPDGLPRLSSIRVDRGVLLFTLAVAGLAAAASGLAPAIAAARLDLVASLRIGGRGPIGSASRRGRRALVVAQVALAVIVVASAGLLARSLQRLETADMGLASDRIVFVELDLPIERYADQRRRGQFLDALVERLQELPGIEGATPINALPFAGATGWDVPRFTAEGQSADQVLENPALNLEAIHPTYFSTLQVMVLRGRAFLPTDVRDAPHVAIVSDGVAARAWPGQDPVGQRLKMGGPGSDDEWLTIVGVAATTRYRALATPRPTLYVPAAQFMITADRLAVRTSAGPASALTAVRESARVIDSTVTVTRARPYGELLAIPLAWPRFNALLLTVFAIAALLLSSVGLYGVLAASVGQRHAEIGVRMSLGATAADIRRLILGEGLRLAVVGVTCGLAIALVVARGLEALLFDVRPLDPSTLVGTACVIVGASVLASYLPARRATRVDPIALLRSE